MTSFAKQIYILLFKQSPYSIKDFLFCVVIEVNSFTIVSSLFSTSNGLEIKICFLL